MTTDLPDVLTDHVTAYAVSCLPEAHPDCDVFTITVERRSGYWVAIRNSRFLGKGGAWSYTLGWGQTGEPSTDEEWADYRARLEVWRAEHRHDEATALRLARQAAPHLTVNGYTVTDALRRITS